MLTTPSDKVCPSSPFPRKISEKMEPRYSNPDITNAGAPQRTNDILTLDVCLPPRIFISFAMISNNKLFQNSTRIPGLSSPISTGNFSSAAHGG